MGLSMRRASRLLALLLAVAGRAAADGGPQEGPREAPRRADRDDRSPPEDAPRRGSERGSSPADHTADLPGIEGVPLERVAEEERAELRRVVAAPTVDTEVEGDVRCRRAVYRFLLGNLPLAARAIDALELDESGRYTIHPERAPERFTIDDRAGARAACVRAWDAEGLQVVVARGELDLPLLPKVLGTGVIVTRYAPSADDPARLDARCRVLFKLSSRVLHALAAPVRDVLARVLADKLRLLVRSATVLAEAVERDPWGVLAALEAARAVTKEELAAFREAVLLH